jgi:hypothetical protein
MPLALELDRIGIRVDREHGADALAKLTHQADARRTSSS